MEIKKIDEEFSVCQVEAYTYANLDSEYCFLGKTDEAFGRTGRDRFC